MLFEIYHIWNKGKWKKYKGVAEIKFLHSDKKCLAEIHWYEAKNIGKFDLKAKYFEELKDD